ncbi:hypothetical protein ACMFMG_004074 [Clarireedia jacksonii]
MVTTYARTSILEFTGVLKSRNGGYAKAGEESIDLGIDEGCVAGPQPHAVSGTSHDDCSQQSPSQDFAPASTRTTGSSLNTTALPPPNQTEEDNQSFEELPRLPYDQHLNFLSTGDQALDIFYPFDDSEMLNIFPDGAMPDFSQFETTNFDLDWFNK